MQVNQTTKKHPRTLTEAFPDTVESSVCVYKPDEYESKTKSINSFILFMAVVILSIVSFLHIVFW
jgi:hypothetical protein